MAVVVVAVLVVLVMVVMCCDVLLLFSLRGAADPISDASSVEASGFEFKFSEALDSCKIYEKLFEASWLHINAAKQRKKKGKKGKGGTEKREREEEERRQEET